MLLLRGEVLLGVEALLRVEVLRLHFKHTQLHGNLAILRSVQGG